MKPTHEIDFLHLLFPQVRAEILRILFFDPTRETYGGEAARATTLALRTVQRELLILEAVGLLTSREKGHSVSLEPSAGTAYSRRFSSL
jgi:hypothetical protein